MRRNSTQSTHGLHLAVSGSNTSAPTNHRTSLSHNNNNNNDTYKSNIIINNNNNNNNQSNNNHHQKKKKKKKPQQHQKTWPPIKFAPVKSSFREACLDVPGQLVAVVLLGVIVFYNSLHGDFVYDDRLEL